MGSPVTQLRAGPSERELERLEEEISEQLGGTVEISPAPAEPARFARPNVPVEAALLEVIAPSEAAPAPSEAAPRPSTSAPPPWYARHARKLIAAAGAAVLIVSYTAWKVPADAPRRIQPQPAIPQASVPATAAPAARPATPAPAAPPPVQAPPSAPRAAVSRASPPPAPTVAAPSTGPRPPSVTHTQREPAPARAAPAAAAPATAAPAAAAPAKAAPPVAAPVDCPDAVVALGLCASQARKGGK